MAENYVEVKELGFSYGDLEIFRGLTLSIPRGKVVGILGGSGSGKSTLLKLIGGQLAPSRGSVTVWPARTCTSSRRTSFTRCASTWG
jgi:phospholipid/cholesterol/gamma-HCH transport system ATP-binding protein